MKKFCSLLAGISLLFSVVQAQTVSDDALFYHRSGGGISNSTNPGEANFSGKSGTGANIDVIYQRLSWNIDPTIATKTITGTVTTYFRTITGSVNTITFDLNQAAFNNGSLVVTYHGITCTRTLSSSNILSITLPSTIASSNTLDSLTINYSGIPPNPSGAAQGYQRQTPALGGYNVAIGNYITTLSESYEDKDWWPCKADMQDKIDSLDIFVTTPWNVATADTFWAASNGKLLDSTITGNTRRFHFRHSYPIASYLVSVSVAKFDRHYRVTNINGTNTQVAFYLIRGKTAATVTNILIAMDKITPAVTMFSARFGDYPFKAEKHGFYDGLLGSGGMEHQTFSAIAPSALTNIKTLIHELAHQWFGNNVSFATWNDLWLAEGFARYSEAYAGEVMPALLINPYTTRVQIKNQALMESSEPAWIPDAFAATSDGQWLSNYGNTVYERGAMVVSMLRTLCGDSVFFKVLKKYQTDLAGKTATTDTLRNYFNRELGQDISEFFTDYVGGSGPGASPNGGIGNPTYNINWGNPSGTTFRVAIASQTYSVGSNVPYFNGPVSVHVTNGPVGSWTKDTTIVFYDGGSGNLAYAGKGMSALQPGNMLQYNLSFVPTNVFFDDSARLLAQVGTINKVNLLDMQVTDFTVKQNRNGNYATLVLDDNSMNSAIYLERSSDAVDFSLLNEMSLLPDVNGSKKYGYNDTDPLKGTSYYRAKYNVANGNTFYSKIIKVSDAINSGFSIVNNPVSGKLKILMNNTNNGEQFGFVIYDAQGKTVYQEEKKLSGAITELDTERLSTGNYVLSIVSADKTSVSLKFVIK